MIICETEKGILAYVKLRPASDFATVKVRSGTDFPPNFFELDFRGCLPSPDMDLDKALEKAEVREPRAGDYLLVKTFLRGHWYVSSKVVSVQAVRYVGGKKKRP